MARPLCRKGFPLFNDVAELVDGTHATGKNSFQAGQPTPAPSTQNAAASVSTSYEPVIDLELLYQSLKRGTISEVEQDPDVHLVMYIH